MKKGESAKLPDYSSHSSRNVHSLEVKKYAEKISLMKKEMSKTIIGQDKVIDGLIRAILCDGHILLEGVPGIAKTLAIKSLSKVSGCKSERIQFTVDLLPTDIVGLTIYDPHKGFEVVKGPIFSNFIIADEINRSPPKTQSALMEAMQEKQVTIGKKTFKLERPFFVMANQNPLENSGVYSLPEAQIDRFLFKILVDYPTEEEEKKIMENNTTTSNFEDYNLKSIISPNDILKMQSLVKKIYVDDRIRDYIVRMVLITRSKDFKYGELIDWGCSPRATISLLIAARAQAFMKGRNFVIPRDVKDVAHDVLRHRIILSYRAKAEGTDADKIISHIIEKEVLTE